MNQQVKQPIEPDPENLVTSLVVNEATPAGEELTLDALAVREKGAGAAIARAKMDILKIYRESSIGMTFPEDWILFKRPDESGGGITGFLSDAGCKRVLPLWGIDIIPEGGAKTFCTEKADVGDDYLITVRGDGFNHTTLAGIKGVEGCRGSDEDFVKSQTGTRKLAYVRKAAFRNMEGNIVRKLTGLDAVPLSELQRIWQPLGRNWELAARGRGFGGSAVRYGDAGDDVTGPKCPICSGSMKLIRPKAEQKWSAFWGCNKGKGKCPGTVKDSDWNAELAKRPAESSAPEGEPPPGGDNYVSPGGNIGEDKNRLLERIKGTAWEKEFKSMILKATSADDLLDVLTAINDREKGASRG